MANSYENFVEYFNKFSEYSAGHKSASEGRLSPNLKELAANLVSDEPFKNYVRSTRDTGVLMAVLGKASEITKRKGDEIVSGNLENILKEAPETDIKLGVQIVEPKDNYTGNKSGLYSEIANLHKEVRSIGETLQNEDYKKMQTKLKELYGRQYGSNDEKDALEILNVLVENDMNFNKFRYHILFSEKQKQFGDKLQGNEPGYLAANLEGKDFFEFYAGLLQMKEELTKQSQGQSGRQNPRDRSA